MQQVAAAMNVVLLVLAGAGILSGSASVVLLLFGLMGVVMVGWDDLAQRIFRGAVIFGGAFLLIVLAAHFLARS